MATYTELHTLFSDDTLRDKVASAVAIKADAVRVDGASTAAQNAWAEKAFSNPNGEAKRFLIALLGANESASVATIQGATDATIQTAVDNAFQLFVDADAGV